MDRRRKHAKERRHLGRAVSKVAVYYYLSAELAFVACHLGTPLPNILRRNDKIIVVEQVKG